MKNLLHAGALALALFACAPVMAQHASDSFAPAGKAPEYTCTTWSGGAIGSGTLVPCPASAGVGGSGGDASAANQTTQITAEQAIQAAIGAVSASPTANTVQDRLKTLNTALAAILAAQLAATPAGELHIGEVGGKTIIGSCASSPCFTTTSATTAWAIGNLIGDSTTAASVTKMQFDNLCRVSNGTGMIRRVRVKVASDTGFAGQTLNVRFYKLSPTLTAGDRAAWLTPEADYLGYAPVKLAVHFSDYEKGIGVPVDDSGNPTEINYQCNGTSGPVALLTAGTAITPQAGSKAVTVVLEVLGN